MGRFGCVSLRWGNEGAPNACAPKFSAKLADRRYPCVRYLPFRGLSYGARTRPRKQPGGAGRPPGRRGLRGLRRLRSTEGNGGSSAGRAFGRQNFRNSHSAGAVCIFPKPDDFTGARTQPPAYCAPYRTFRQVRFRSFPPPLPSRGITGEDASRRRAEAHAPAITPDSRRRLTSRRGDGGLRAEVPLGCLASLPHSVP